jgi:hypothetical protein
MIAKESKLKLWYSGAPRIAQKNRSQVSKFIERDGA